VAGVAHAHRAAQHGDVQHQQQRQVFGRRPEQHPHLAESLALLLVLYVTIAGLRVWRARRGHIGMERIGDLMPERWKKPNRDPDPPSDADLRALMAWFCFELLLSVRTYMIPTLHVSEAFRYVPW